MLRPAVLMLTSMLVACTPVMQSHCPGPEVVEIERVRYVPIPRHLSTYSEVLDHRIDTNGDLLEAYRAWKEAAEERGRLLDEVRALE
jgi:hypothetical protein